MIKNVIFDIGSVLLSFNREFLLKTYYNGEDYKTLSDLIFVKWDRQDEGKISVEDYTEERVNALPEHLRSIARTILGNWEYSMYYKDGMVDLVRELKEKGYKLYILSNMTYHFIKRDFRYPLFKEFDGIVYSAPIKMMKPNQEIFSYVINKYSLEPTETVFVDDLKENLAAAARFKINTFLYQDNTDKLKEFIYSL